MSKKSIFMLPKESHTPDHLFQATLTCPGKRKFRMLCAITLPKNKDERIKFDFYPSVQQALSMRPWSVVSLSGKSVFGESIYKFYAKEVLCTPIATGSFHDISFVTNFEGSPTELQIEMMLEGKRGKHLSRGTFNLTDCPVINARSMTMRSYTGEVRVRALRSPKFRLNPNAEVQFKHHFDSSEGKEGETLTRWRLVAECSIEPRSVRSDFEKIEADLALLLSLASVASRYKCVCKSWEYSDDGNCSVKHYYQNIVLPDGSITSRNNTLIDISKFEEFVKRTYKSYKDHSYRGLLENAIAILVSEKTTLEDKFTRQFAALQSIFWAAYRQSGNSETNVKMHRLHNIFCRHYKQFDTDDLWPLFEPKSGSSLNDLRNHIAHGEPVLESKAVALSIATGNLQWTVERALLAVLGWPIEESKVSPQALRLWSSYNWISARKSWTI